VHKRINVFPKARVRCLPCDPTLGILIILLGSNSTVINGDVDDDVDGGVDDDVDDDVDGDEALRQLTTTLLFLFSNGNHIATPLLERLRRTVKTTFYPDTISASHVADHVGSCWCSV
jgi:hypothetical protein